MIKCGGVWLPDGETHLVKWMEGRGQWIHGKLTYQYDKLLRAVALTTQQRVAIDVGAHCGLWSMHLARLFERVLAYEPVAEFRECFEVNCEKHVNIALHGIALGAADTTVTMVRDSKSSGNTWPDPAHTGGPTSMRRLDSLHPGGPLRDVDLVKVDCEGYELHVLEGMEQTLVLNKPVVVVEQKPGMAEKFGLEQGQAVRFLQGLGAELDSKVSGDYFMRWPA